jgi:Fic family protein
MNQSAELEHFEEEIVGRARAARVAAAPAHLRTALRLEETWASCALAGSALTLSQTRALLQRGVVAGDRAFRDYLLVWGYGNASAWVFGQAGLRARAAITLNELREIHSRVTSGLALVESAAKPGAWRTVNAPPFRGGVVPTPPALIVSETATLIDRFGYTRPVSMPRFVWIATLHARLERMRPFASANGRVARLAVNLLLTRLGFPPLIILPRYARAYRRAIEAADAGDLDLLAWFIARGVERNLARYAVPAGLRPLAALAGDASLAALRKAATRGRLRHVYRGGRLYSTPEWRDDYLRDRKERR